MNSFTVLNFGAFRLTAALCCLGVLATGSRAAGFQARWNELAPLLEGRELSIPLQGGAVVTGELLNVRTDSLNLDIRKVSGRTEYRKGPASIPRGSVTTIRATKTQGAWGRRMGVLIGQIAGLIAGGELVAHLATTERSGVPTFVAVDVGATVAGYYLGKSRDKRELEIAVVPASEAERQGAEVAPAATGQERGERKP
jgi:hypothetical protein